MARISRMPKLPPSSYPIERVRCCVCGRTWAVYEGKVPRMWSIHSRDVFCDRRSCTAALDQARQMAKAAP